MCLNHASFQSGIRVGVKPSMTASDKSVFEELQQSSMERESQSTGQTLSPTSEGPPRPKRVDGWAEESPSRGKGKKKKNTSFEEDKRLQQDTEDVMVIPELEELQEEALTTEVAAPPSVAVNRVATYKELDSDLQKHAGLFTLEGKIDLKLLAKVLSPESEIREEDKPWEWSRLFAEVSSDIQRAWTNGGGNMVESPSNSTLPTPRIL